MMKTKSTTQLDVNAQTLQDFKHSVLLVSLGANLFVFTAWLVTQVSSDYAILLATNVR